MNTPLPLALGQQPETPATSPEQAGKQTGRLPLTEPAAPLVLPIIEERALVRREVAETGRVRLTRHVTEADEPLHIALRHEEISVERVPLNQQLPAGAATPAVRYEGETMIIPVLREVAVVETRLVLVEELRVTTRHLTTEHTETVRLRHEELTVERVPAPPAPRLP